MQTYTSSELLTINAARLLRDGDVVFVGVGLPNLACNLARNTHAPNLVMIYEAGVIGAQPARLPLSIGDPTLVSGATSVMSMAPERTSIAPGESATSRAASRAGQRWWRCEVIGSGSLDPSVGCLSYGTTATININHSRYIEPITLLPAYPSAVPSKHTVEVQVFRGFWMVNWFKEEFGHLEKRQAAEMGLTPEQLFDKLVDEITPGSMGLMLQPYWTPGVKTPGPEAKGAIIGFGDVHTRAHLYRSILEGLAYALRDGKERIEKRSRTPITSLRVSGGGSQSRHAMQVTADVFNLPTSRPHLYETSGLGAAIDAAVGLGLHDKQ